MTALSPYQQFTYSDRTGGARPDYNAMGCRMLELVEQGLTIGEAEEEMGKCAQPIRENAPQIWAKIKSMSAYNRKPTRTGRSYGQREFETLVRFMCSGDIENDWAIPVPFRQGQHLVGKRHNIPKAL